MSANENLDTELQKSIGALEQLITTSKLEAPVQAEPLAKSIRTGVIERTPAAEGLIDGTEFLKSLVETLDASIHSLAKSQFASQTEIHTLIKGMGSVVVQQQQVIDEMNKSMGALHARILGVERSPAPRRSVRTAEGVTKSRQPGDTTGGGDEGNDNKLTKSQVGRGLTMLVMKAADSDNRQALGRLNIDTASFENGHGVSKQTGAALRTLHAQNLI